MEPTPVCPHCKDTKKVRVVAIGVDEKNEPVTTEPMYMACVCAAEWINGPYIHRVPVLHRRSGGRTRSLVASDFTA